MRTLVIVALVTLPFNPLPAAAQVQILGQPGPPGCSVSMADYLSLRAQMTYDRVATILGCRGEEISRSERSGLRTTMYKWRGRGSVGANMNAMFQNGLMVSKAQSGLQ